MIVRPGEDSLDMRRAYQLGGRVQPTCRRWARLLRKRYILVEVAAASWCAARVGERRQRELRAREIDRPLQEPAIGRHVDVAGDVALAVDALVDVARAEDDVAVGHVGVAMVAVELDRGVVAHFRVGGTAGAGERQQGEQTNDAHGLSPSGIGGRCNYRSSNASARLHADSKPARASA